MNNIVLTESKLKELEQFSRYLENVSLSTVTNKDELRITVKALSSVYNEMLGRIKS